MVKTIADRPGSKEEDLAALREASKVSLCVRLLIEAGLSLGKDVQAVIDDPDFRRRLVEIWKTRCRETSISQLVAKGIMGSNMIGIAEMFDCFCVAFSREHQISELDTIPFTAEVLHACKETHILFPGYPLSIMKMRGFYPALFSSRDGRWYDDKSFAKDEKVQCRWYLLLKSGVCQEALRENGTFVPRACEVVFGLILANRLREHLLFAQSRVACGREPGNFVYVGFPGDFGKWEISIGDVCNDPPPQFALIMQ